MLRKKLFGNNISKNCSYCVNSYIDSAGDYICRIFKHSKKDNCKKFKYDPLKRKPSIDPRIPKYDPSEFSL